MSRFEGAGVVISGAAQRLGVAERFVAQGAGIVALGGTGRSST